MSDAGIQLFASYSSGEWTRIEPIVKGLREVGLKIWAPSDDLKPGQDWVSAISVAIEKAEGILLFLTESVPQSKYVLRELELAVMRDLPVFAIRIGSFQVSDTIKYYLSDQQLIDLGSLPTDGAITQLGEALWTRLVEQSQLNRNNMDGLASSPSESSSQCHDHEGGASGDLPDGWDRVRNVAKQVAFTVRKEEVRSPIPSIPNSVFIVHGHDEEFLQEVEQYLQELGVISVVLRKVGGPSKSLLDKFMQWGDDTRFAIALLTADDIGASCEQYEMPNVGPKALQFRARQNVILELGYFFGRLGWEKVFVLFKKPNVGFPNFEWPSDLAGVVFDQFDESGSWKTFLHERLAEAGFVLQSPQ